MNRILNLAAITLFSSFIAGCGAPGDEEPTGTLTEGLVTCSGEACNGQDPGTSGCDADLATYTAASASIGGIGTVAIRVSPACNAVWTRVSAPTPYYMRAELVRGTYGTASASPTAVTAQRSPMIGYKTGVTYTATGRLGPSFNFYQRTGSVSRTF